MLPFDRPDILLVPDLGLPRQFLPLSFGSPLPLQLHPLPDLPGQTDRQPWPVRSASDRRHELPRVLWRQNDPRGKKNS